MMKRKLMYSILMLIIAIIAMTSALFAWFTPTAQYIEDIILTSGNLEMQSTLYRIEDFDLDGNFDVVNDDYVYTSIQQLIINDMKPDDVYSYRLDVKNIGDAEGSLTAYFEGVDQALRQVLTFESQVKNSQGEIIETAGTQGKKLLSNQDLLFASISSLNVQEQVSIYFDIRFETLDQLKALNPTVFNSMENLNAYQNLVFSVAAINVKLEQNI